VQIFQFASYSLSARVDVDPGFGDLLRDVLEEVRERRRIAVGIHEDERPPRLERELDEPELPLLDPALAVGAGRGEQPPVEAVRPRVVGALQRLPLARALADDRAAVAADVDERAQDAVVVADEEHRGVAGARGVERAGLGDLVRARDVLPEAAEDSLLLHLQRGRVDVPAPGDRACADRAHPTNATDDRSYG
jgi:hypothetical protein